MHFSAVLPQDAYYVLVNIEPVCLQMIEENPQSGGINLENMAPYIMDGVALITRATSGIG